MKLLRKTEVIALKEQEKAREAAEGLKIARKIDELRELQSNTEKKLNDFRNSSLRTIGEEMKNLGEKRDYLAAEVSSLQKKLDSMLPGIGTKREELAEREKKLNYLDSSLKKQKEKLDLQEIDIVEAKKELSDAIEWARTERSSAALAHKKAEEAQAEALSRLFSAKTIESRAEKEKATQDAFFANWKSELTVLETKLRTGESEFEQENRKLEQEKVKLEDRKRMVERTIERLRKQRINVE